MDSIFQKLLGCSFDQAETLVSLYRDETGWHAETVIGAAGALLGHAIQTSAYSMAAQGTGSVHEFERSTNPPFGKFVDCGERVALFIDNEFAFLRKVGAQLDWFAAEALPDMPTIVEAFVDQIGSAWFPRLSVATEHMPREWSADAVPQYAEQMRAHLNRHELPLNVCEVLSLTLALGHLVSACRDRLDPAIALRIGLETAVATTQIGNLERRYTVFASDGFGHDMEAEADAFIERMTVMQDDGAMEPDGVAAADDVALIKGVEEDADEAPPAKPKIVFMESAPVNEIAVARNAPEDVNEPEDVNGAELGEELLADVATFDDDIDTLPTPRASRLGRTRPSRAAFGKRQFG